MKLPEFVKKIGTVEGKNRVYVEDYVYSYLNDLREKKSILPLRAALYGHVFHKENKCYYFVYGAACVIEELENGRDEEQTRNKFFEEYELIGYVNICKDKQIFPEKSKGYYIFYESNEAMQSYLLSCYKKECRESQTYIEEVPEKTTGYLLKHSEWRNPKELLKKLFYGICIAVLATAATTINNFERMNGFVETARKAIVLTDTQYQGIEK